MARNSQGIGVSEFCPSGKVPESGTSSCLAVWPLSHLSSPLNAGAWSIAVFQGCSVVGIYKMVYQPIMINQRGTHRTLLLRVKLLATKGFWERLTLSSIMCLLRSLQGSCGQLQIHAHTYGLGKTQWVTEINKKTNEER